MSDAEGPSRLVAPTVVAALCVAAAVLAVTSMRVKSLTFDEMLYLPAGYAAVAEGDLRVSPGHPPLMKALAGLPLLALEPALPTDDPSWDAMLASPEAAQWDFAGAFVRANADQLETLTFWARLPNVAVLLLLIVGVFLFARDVYGPVAGCVAAGLAAFDPNLLAHGRLATVDLGLTAGLLFAVYAFWRYTRAPSGGRLLVAGVAAGLALLTKATAALLLPMLVIWVTALPFLRGGVGAPPASWGVDVTRSRRTSMLFLTASVAGLGLVALLVVSVGYLRPGDPRPYLQSLGLVAGIQTPGYLSYLHGTFSAERFPQYFAVAFLVKTPLALLALLVARALLRPPPDERRRAAAVVLLVPVVVVLAAMSWRATNIGLRYVLPIYPFLCIVVSGLVRGRSRRVGLVLVLVVGLGGVVVESVSAYPDYLPFFNVAAGGPEHGIDWLDDSNVDWGQDLIQLRAYLRAEDLDRVAIATMTWYAPALYGIAGEWLTAYALLERLSSREPPPGTYVVSRHLLNRASFYPGLDVARLRARAPDAVIGHTLNVYRLD